MRILFKDKRGTAIENNLGLFIGYRKDATGAFPSAPEAIQFVLDDGDEEMREHQIRRVAAIWAIEDEAVFKSWIQLHFKGDTSCAQHL